MVFSFFPFTSSMPLLLTFVAIVLVTGVLSLRRIREALLQQPDAEALLKSLSERSKILLAVQALCWVYGLVITLDTPRHRTSVTMMSSTARIALCNSINATYVQAHCPGAMNGLVNTLNSHNHWWCGSNVVSDGGFGDGQYSSRLAACVAALTVRTYYAQMRALNYLACMGIAFYMRPCWLVSARMRRKSFVVSLALKICWTGMFLLALLAFAQGFRGSGCLELHCADV
jgi:hypothetical protein